MPPAMSHPIRYFAPHSALDEAFGASARENRNRKGADKEDRRRRPEIPGARNDRVRDTIERRRASQRPEERHDKRYRPENDLLSPRIAAQPNKRGTSKYQYYSADVIAMKVNPISPPVVVEHARELGQVRVQKLLRGPGI